MSSKILYEVDFDFSDVDKEVALEKMTYAATKVGDTFFLSCICSLLFFTHC